MKKFVATALTVVAPSVEKSSKVSDSKKRSAKEDVESDILVKSPPAKSHQQKSIADIRKEDPKIKLKCNVGVKSLPTTQICVSCKILPPSNLSIFFILPSTQFYVSCKVLPLESPIFQHLTQKKWLKNCIFYRVFGKIFYLHNFIITECSLQFSCF